MNYIMPEEQRLFIEKVKKYMLEATTMSESDANDFAFQLWTHKEGLLKILGETE